MRLNFIILLGIGLLAYGLTFYFNHNKQPNMVVQFNVEHPVKAVPGDPAPDFTFTARDGQARKLSNFKGKIVVLNFWASWCAPCLKEFPALLSLAEAHEDVVLIALSSDYNPAAMRRFLDKMKKAGQPLERPNIFIALDEESRITGGLYQSYRLPETYIINREGIMQHKLIGADWEQSTVSDLLSTL